MGEGRCCVGAAGNAKRYLVAGYQLKLANLVEQARIAEGLDLIQRLEVFCIGYIVKQANGRKLGIDQAVCLQTFAFSQWQRGQRYHCAPRNASMRRKVSYSEIMSPWAMTANGERPLKNALWFSIEAKP